MHTSTTLTRFRRLLVVGAVVAGAIVPAAAAVGRPPTCRTLQVPTSSRS